MACRNYTGVDNSSMRINLVTPFAEKDAVKALGARWDATRKVWFIQDVADLTPQVRNDSVDPSCYLHRSVEKFLSSG